MRLLLMNIDSTLSQLIKNQMTLLDPLNTYEKIFVIQKHGQWMHLSECDNDIIIINVINIDELQQFMKIVTSNKYKRNKVIVVGSDTSYNFIRKAFRLGIHDYWIKPYQNKMVVDTLSELIEVTPEDHNSGSIRTKLVEAIKSNNQINRLDLESIFRDFMAILQTDVSKHNELSNLILDLLNQLQIEPISILKKKISMLSATWILDQENYFESLYQVLEWIRVIYQDIFYPNIDSKLVRNAIYEVLAPSIHLKTVKYISNKMFINQNYLSTTFKKYTEISLSEYIKRVKMYGAMWMLLDQDYSIDDILDIIGYKDEQHFSRIFKEKTGVLPGSYRHINRRYHLKK